VCALIVLLLEFPTLSLFPITFLVASYTVILIPVCFVKHPVTLCEIAFNYFLSPLATNIQPLINRCILFS